MSKAEVPEGLKVRYEHGETAISPQGRQLGRIHRCTYASLHQTDPDGNILWDPVAVGMSVCAEDRGDTFSRAIGRQASLGRALKQLRQQAAGVAS